MAEDLLQSGNIRCVPSIHGRAAFARIAELEVASWHPGVVAVEVPWIAERDFLLALGRLPQIQAVTIEARPGAGGTAGPLSLLVLDPADSIVAAARRALEMDVPVRCIDLHVPGYRPPDNDRAPDERLIDLVGLHEYYRLWMDRCAGSGGLDRATLKREVTMAAHLAELARVHERVLAVLGMAHWERVKRLASRCAHRPTRRRWTAPQRLEVGRADVDRRALPGLLRQLPFYAAHYERHRPAVEGYSTTEAMASLFTEANMRIEPAAPMAVPALRRLGTLVRRLSHSRRLLTPGLCEILTASKAIAGREFAKHVLRVSQEYPQKDPSGDLPEIVPWAGHAGQPRRMGRIIAVPWGGSGDAEEVKRLREMVRELEGEYPEEACREWRGSLFVTDREENRREDEVGLAIRARFVSRGSWITKTQEFICGLHAGLDVRRTLIDTLGRRRLFIKRRSARRGPDSDLVGAVVIVFQRRSGSDHKWDISFWKDCDHTGPKFWKVGYHGERERTVGDGWVYASYSALVIVFDRTRPVEVVRKIWADEVAPYRRCHDACVRVALRHALQEMPIVGYVGPEPPSEELFQEAARQGRRLVYRDIESMRDLVEKIRGFRMRWSKDHPDAE